jgi:hypothetical protein
MMRDRRDRCSRTWEHRYGRGAVGHSPGLSQRMGRHMNGKSRSLLTLLVAGAFLASAGCLIAERSTGPGRTGYLYACDTWVPCEPQGATGIFDVYLDRYDARGDADGPSDAMRQAVLWAGGRIVHEFHIQAVRAELRVSVIPRLPVGYVQSAGQPNRYPVDAIIAFKAAVSDSDRAFLRSVGATILGEMAPQQAVHASVPDESIPQVRAHLTVEYLELNSVGCLLEPGSGR